MKKIIHPVKDWEWFGHAAHFICGAYCRFHLATRVGPYLISTVGEYFPDEEGREINAEVRGVALEGRGGARRADYMEKIGFEDIGCGRKYETFVFWLGDKFERCSNPNCNCGLPSPDNWGEIWGEGANTPGDARNNHMKACELASRNAINKDEDKDG
jgi:hypothetical protein